MLTFSDAPYTYHPPKTSRFAIWLFGIFNRYFILPGKKNRISGITLLNPEVITGLPGGSSKRKVTVPSPDATSFSSKSPVPVYTATFTHGQDPAPLINTPPIDGAVHSYQIECAAGSLW